MENKMYCSFCGEENNINDDTCKKCHRFLKRNDHPLMDYMEDKIAGNLKGKVKNTFFSVLENYIKSHLYGFIMTLSILASATTVLVNVKNSNENVNYVKEKMTPEVKITYQGEGLSSYELAKKYIDAIMSEEIETAKGLQLETFYPEIKESIKNYQEETKLDFYYAPALQNHLYDNRDIYFKMNETLPLEGIEKYYLGDSELVKEHQNYLNYQTDNYMFGPWYCSNHTCPTFNGRLTYDFSPNIQIQVILVGDNYYILGEKVTIYMGQNEEVYHMALFRSEGDTTNLNFDEALQEYDSCLDNKECILEHNFNNRNIINDLNASKSIVE